MSKILVLGSGLIGLSWQLPMLDKRLKFEIRFWSRPNIGRTSYGYAKTNASQTYWSLWGSTNSCGPLPT